MRIVTQNEQLERVVDRYAIARYSHPTWADIESKFLLNARHGGYDAARAEQALKLASNVFGGRIDLSALRG